HQKADKPLQCVVTECILELHDDQCPEAGAVGESGTRLRRTRSGNCIWVIFHWRESIRTRSAAARMPANACVQVVSQHDSDHRLVSKSSISEPVPSLDNTRSLDPGVVAKIVALFWPWSDVRHTIRMPFHFSRAVSFRAIRNRDSWEK